MGMKLDPEDHSRARGILSERERNYLDGTADIEPMSDTERQLRYRIRKRTVNAIYDFSLLFEELDQTDREQIFEALGGPEGREAMVDTIAFLLYGDRSPIDATVNWPPDVGEDPPYAPDRNRAFLEAALHRAARRAGYLIDGFAIDEIDERPLSQDMKLDDLARELDERGLDVEMVLDTVDGLDE